MRRIPLLFVLLSILLFLSSGCTSFKDKKGSRSAGVPEVLRALAPEEVTFTINPGEKNTITGPNGSSYLIPKDAFVYKSGKTVTEEVSVSITESVNALDIISLGLPMTYTDREGDFFYFESAGMFSITAVSKGKELQLSDSARIYVKFPRVVSGNYFNEYKLDRRGNWVLPYENVAVTDEETEWDGEVDPYREFEINSLGWWNFDYPDPAVACLKGTIVIESDQIGEKLYVYSLGISNIGTHLGIIENNTFRVNILRGIKGRVLIIDEAGNFGLSELISVTPKEGDQNYPEAEDNFFQDIGTITIKPDKNNLMKDREAFLNLLGLTEEDLEEDE